MGRKARSRVKRGMTQTVVEQLALVTMKLWVEGALSREGLTRGTMSGTVEPPPTFTARGLKAHMYNAMKDCVGLRLITSNS